MATRQDDRTAEQKTQTLWLVKATDKFMSGWGGASGGKSVCAWACDSYAKAEALLKWVENRSEMKYVDLVGPKWSPKLGKNDHLHIYWASDDHPAIPKRLTA